VKTAYATYPKKFLEDTMKIWPGGSYLVLEATDPEGIGLIAVGYKYNSTKAMCFVATQGAGHTMPGKEYLARWKDENNNTCVRKVFRPDIIAKYFKDCNVIDVHNQNRQFNLKLEKHWLTKCGFFRIATTLFGMTVTDACCAYKYHLNHRHKHKDIGVVQFASMLALDCLTNKFTDARPSDSVLEIDVTQATTETDTAIEFLSNKTTMDEQSIISALSSPTGSSLSGNLMERKKKAIEELKCKHILTQSDEMLKFTSHQPDGHLRKGKRHSRGSCRACKRKTAWFCAACDNTKGAKRAWYCAKHVRPDCQTKHHADIVSDFISNV
jgi:hypothetical protein